MLRIARREVNNGRFRTYGRKSRRAARSRREATRMSWTPSGSFQSSASSRRARISSSLRLSTSRMPSLAGASPSTAGICFAFAMEYDSSSLGLYAAQRKVEFAVECLLEHVALALCLEQLVLAAKGTLELHVHHVFFAIT